MRFLSAGESHGVGLVGILEGVPSGLVLDFAKIDRELARRRNFYGRSDRMNMENDRVQFLSGIAGGVTTGAPIAFYIANADFRSKIFNNELITNSTQELSQNGDSNAKQGEQSYGRASSNDFSSREQERLFSWMGEQSILRPRPSHADFAGTLKYGMHDARLIAERASGRETINRVVIGAIAKQLLGELGVRVASHVISIGGRKTPVSYYSRPQGNDVQLNADSIAQLADSSVVRCLDESTSLCFRSIIDEAKETGNTVGGSVEVVASGMPLGFGSHVHFDRRLDGLLSAQLMGIPAVKAVGFGNISAFLGHGSESSDPICLSENGIYRPTNNSGGIEGGISNGADIVAQLVIKPVPSMAKPIATIDFESGVSSEAHYERSDICIVPTISIIAESVIAYGLTGIIVDELGGDTMQELKQRFLQKKECINRFFCFNKSKGGEQ